MIRQLKKWAPALAVIVVAVSYAWALGWFDSGDTDAPSEPGVPAIAEAPASPAVPGISTAKPVKVPEYREAADSTGWSTYHGGSSLRGVADSTLPDAPGVLWRYQAETAIYHTPVASEEGIFFSTIRGGVIGIDREGKELWSKRMVREIRKDGRERMERFDAPIAVFESIVVIGSLSGKLFAFDAATGEEKWIYDLDNTVLGTVNLDPSVPGGAASRIFVIGQEDGALHCLELHTGKHLWATESIDRCDGSPSIADGVIVFGSCAAALHVFSTEDGSNIRNIEIDPDSQIASGVALVGDSAFSGSHSGKLIHANWRTGEIVWLNQDSEGEIFSTPAVNRDWVVFASDDGSVYALDRVTGIQKWRYETNGWPTSPVIAGDKVVFSSDGVLYLLRLETGEELWTYEVSDEISSPAIIDGMIVVGSEDGTVTAFGAPRG